MLSCSVEVFPGVGTRFEGCLIGMVVIGYRWFMKRVVLVSGYMTDELKMVFSVLLRRQV